MPRSHRLAPVLTFTLMLLVLAACLPGTEAVLAPPSFRLQAVESGLMRLDLATVGAPSASFRLVMDVVNPNPVGVRLASLEGDLYLADVPAAGVRFVDGLDLPARGQARLVLDLRLSGDALPALSGVFADALAGRAVTYRLDAEAGVDLLGGVQRFPRTTLLTGSISSDLRLASPRLSLDRDASSVRSVGFDRVVIDVVVIVHNDGPVGMQVRAPDVRFGLGGREVATIHVPTIALAAGANARVAQEVVLNPVQLGAAIVTELTRLAGGQAGGVEVTLRGGWELEVPGVLTRSVDVAELLRARLE